MQLPIATISPCRVGLPVKEFWFTPVQIRSPRLFAAAASLEVSELEVWLTMAVPKAANGQVDPEAARAALAARIQWVRVEEGMPFTVSGGLEMGCCAGLRDSLERCADVKLLKARSEASRGYQGAMLCLFYPRYSWEVSCLTI